MDSDSTRTAFAGVTAVLAPGDDVARFEQPARGDRGRAAVVALPASVDEVRGIVEVARRQRVRVLPQGANTGLVGASVPPADVPVAVLSTERLRQPLDLDVANATALVGAGTLLSELNAAAATAGLCLPIDIAADPAIGGMIATNTGGARVMRYGSMRHHLLGVELVAADADTSLYGRLSALHKDSRGIEWAHVALGSGGTLGVITRAVVALTPLPGGVEAWWLALDDPTRAVELLELLDAHRPGTMSAFEFVSARALERTLAAPGSPPNPFDHVPAAAVLAEWTFDEYRSNGVQSVAADLDRAFGAGLISDGRLVDDQAAWALRHRISDSLRTHGVVLGHDVSAPRSVLMAVRRQVVDAVAGIAPTAEVCDFGHAGDGGLHLNVLFPGATTVDAGVRATIRRAIDEIVAAAGGSYSAEHGLGPLNAERWLADTSPFEQRLVAGLKGLVDPEGVLGHPAHPYNRL